MPLRLSLPCSPATCIDNIFSQRYINEGIYTCVIGTLSNDKDHCGSRYEKCCCPQYFCLYSEGRIVNFVFNISVDGGEIFFYHL